MNRLWIRVRRYDGSWRVFSSDAPPRRKEGRLVEGPDVHFDHQGDSLSLEHVNVARFREAGDAHRFAREIRSGLRRGRDLNLSYWNLVE